MTVLVDLDDVLIGTSETWVRALNIRYHTTVKHNNISEWDITKFFPTLSSDEIYQPLSEPSFWRHVKQIPDAEYMLLSMIYEGMDVYIVTSSYLSTIGMKYENVIKRLYPFIKPNHIIVAHRKQMVSGDVLIDDAPFNLEGGNYNKILFNAPHNKSYDIGDSGIVRASNWIQIYNTIHSWR